jgi:hypothetical protein
LWVEIYSSPEGPSWEHLLPYCDENILFKDSVQETAGIDAFTQMVGRLAGRSKNLEVLVLHSSMQGNVIFIEWEMIISYKKYPKTSIYGASRIILNNGKIVDQRDYYDLWGDIFNNIRFVSIGYRKFMKKRFG